MLNIKKSCLYELSLLYLALPVILFLWLWCRWFIGCLGTITIIALIYRYHTHNQNDNQSFILNKKVIIYIGIILLLWCILGGQGGLYYQSSDWGCRNAIFKDLIFKGNPVFYQNDSFLCYYIGHWMVPTVFGKVLLFIGVSHNVVWIVSNLFLLLWTFSGTLLVYLMILSYFNTNRLKDCIIILIVLIFFSGLDIIGLFINDGKLSTHIEWWGKYYQFSSNTTQLFWVFNQAIPAWIGTMLLIKEKSITYDAFVGVLLILFSPLPLFGCFLIVLFKAIQNYIVKKEIKLFLKDLFSIDNMLSFLVFPILVTYIFTNTRTGSGAGGGFNFNIGELNLYNIFIFLVFLFFEYGCYLSVLFKENKKNYMFYCAFFFLPLIAAYRYGFSKDFEMRASIPLLFLVMLMVIKCFLNNISIENRKICFTKKGIILSLIFLIGSITPCVEFYRGYHEVRKNNKIRLVNESVKLKEDSINFVAPEYTKSNFYRFFGE